MFAAFDLGQQADRLDGVLVDGIDMVHVVLGLPDHASEIRQEAPEHTGP